MPAVKAARPAVFALAFCSCTPGPTGEGGRSGKAPENVLEGPAGLLEEGRRQELAGDRDNAQALYEAACLEGAPEGCYLFERTVRTLGKKGAPTPPAATEHEKGCELGSARDCFAMGLLLDDDGGMPKDGMRAFGLFHRACEGGHVYACHREALAYRVTVLSREPDAPMLSLRLSMRACEAGFGGPCAAAAELLDSDGEIALAHTPGALRERACTRGHLPACAQLVDARLTPHGFACDMCPANLSDLESFDPRCVDCAMWVGFEAHCCDTCPERDRHAACADMQLVRKHPKTSAPPDPRALALAEVEMRRVLAIPITMLEPLCQSGDAHACFDLGVLLSHQKWPIFDAQRAEALVKKGCDADVAEACAALARMVDARGDAAGAEALRERARAAYQRRCDAGEGAVCATVVQAP